MNIDGFVVLAPILMLLVIALLGFVGCSFEPGRYSPIGPTNVVAVPGDGVIHLTWDAYPGAIEYNINYGVSPASSTDVKTVGAVTSDTLAGLTNGTEYCIAVTARTAQEETTREMVVCATPQAGITLTRYVTSVMLGTTMNAVNGFAGMAIRIGSASVEVHTLARGFAPGNTGTHTVKIVDGATGSDIPGASVQVTMVPANPGDFQYSPLTQPVTLNPGQLYYVVSEEFAGGDLVHRVSTTITTTGVAVHEGAAFNQNNGPYTNNMMPGTTIGPVDFQYRM